MINHYQPHYLFICVHHIWTCIIQCSMCGYNFAMEHVCISTYGNNWAMIDDVMSSSTLSFFIFLFSCIFLFFLSCSFLFFLDSQWPSQHEKTNKHRLVIFDKLNIAPEIFLFLLNLLSYQFSYDKKIYTFIYLFIFFLSAQHNHCYFHTATWIFF